MQLKNVVFMRVQLYVFVDVYCGMLAQLKTIFMPLTAKKLRGHIALGLCVLACVRPSVTLFCACHIS